MLNTHRNCTLMNSAFWTRLSRVIAIFHWRICWLPLALRVVPVAGHQRKYGKLGLQMRMGHTAMLLPWNSEFIFNWSECFPANKPSSYPNNNCAALYGSENFGPVVNPQDTLPQFLNHTTVVELVKPYVNSANIAKAHNKPFLMFETNTASCGGFPGISNSFAAALWAIDYGLQMATIGFTGANVHVGGQNVYYNVSVAPVHGEWSYSTSAAFHCSPIEWDISPMDYWWDLLCTSRHIWDIRQIWHSANRWPRVWNFAFN